MLSPTVAAAIITPLPAPSELRVVVYLSTRDIALVKLGDPVTLIRRLRDGNIYLTGVISDIASRATVQLSALGIEERRVKVTITPELTAQELFEGYDVDVRFTLAEEKDQLLVPNSALYRRGEQDYVLIIKDGAATQVAVTVGMRTGSETVLKSGVAPGDVVIRDPNLSGLKVGTKVKAGE